MYADYVGQTNQCNSLSLQFCAVLQSINPDETLAYGATVLAAILLNQHVKYCPQDNSIFHSLISVLTIGQETKGGDLITRMIDRRIYYHETLKMTQTFSTCVDNQTVLIGILIKVYEGDCAMVKDNLIIVKILLQGVPPMPRGVKWVEISFLIDSNGVFHMFALEMLTG
jgi:heat shock 70kDa protein 1/2/6/8